MKLIVTQKNLEKALIAVSRIANIRTQLPILNNILLKTDGSRLLIASTNLEVAITQYIGAKITKQGAITVPARLISEFIANLPNDNIELEVKNDNLHIKSGTYTSIINGFIADDFPELPTINEQSSIQYNLKTNDLKQAISQTVFTASSDNTRPILTGIYWHTYQNYLYLVGTDGYRLAEKKLIKTETELKAIIPTQTLQEVVRNINEEIKKIDILFDETQVRFRIDNTEIISRLIDGSFPDYRQLIPTELQTLVQLKKEDFMRITKIANLFARDSGGSVTITTEKEKELISLHSIASQLGENTSEAPAKITEDGQITINSRYLIDALAVINNEEIEFGFNGKMSPCLIRSAEKNSDYYHIIMPLKS